MLESLQKNVNITHLSNYKTQAEALYYYEVNSQEDVPYLSDIYEYATEKGLPILYIGGGTNMLFAFDVYNGVVIKNNLSGWMYDEESKELYVSSNEVISDLALELENKYGQDLWHRFIGLPGSLGGAVYGNAGCFGLEIENNFKEATIYDTQNRQYKKLSKKDMFFSYRSSILKENNNNYFLVSCLFDLSKKVEKYASDTDNIYFREHKQPKGNTCGSFFKNPNREFSAGYLIEQVGLKGYTLGGASFSQLHANFLMHDGTGTYKDLIELIFLAQKKVKAQFDIELINEVRIITNK